MMDVFFDADSESSRGKNAITWAVMGEILRLKSVKIEKAKILNFSEMNAAFSVSNTKNRVTQYSSY